MSSQMILGTGRRAENPYYMERFYVNLYSVEELCFLFVDRAELLDAEIVQKGMIRWLEEECSLGDLAHTLDALLNSSLCGCCFGVCESVSRRCDREDGADREGQRRAEPL